MHTRVIRCCAARRPQAKLDTLQKQFEDQRSQNEVLVKELQKSKGAAYQAEKDLKKARGELCTHRPPPAWILWMWHGLWWLTTHVAPHAHVLAAVITKSRDKQQLSLVLEEKENYQQQVR